MEFGVVSVSGLLIRTPIFALLEAPLQRLFEQLSLALPLTTEFLGHNFALATAVIVVMFWNFFVNRYWTYADVD